MSNQNYERNVRTSRRNSLSYWFPLAVTVSAAALGIAAWVWSERKDDDDDLSRGPSQRQNYSRPRCGSDLNNDIFAPTTDHEDDNMAPQPSPVYNQSYMARMSGALRRTPSPQQIFDGASRSIVDGITAASAVVGSALGSIMEEEKDAYRDHQTWSEEANSRKISYNLGSHSSEVSPGTSQVPMIPIRRIKKKTVAIVISVNNDCSLTEGGMSFQERASILSYLPQTIDFSKTRLFILIYAPLLKEHPLDAVNTHLHSRDSTSKKNIGQTQSDSDNLENFSSQILSPNLFDTVYSEALCLVEKNSMVLPFTTARGHVQILRHLNPDIIYLQESLSGMNGEVITSLQTWLRDEIVLISSDGSTSNRSTDRENEVEPCELKQAWWKNEDRIGRARGIIVIEAFRVGDDWVKRVEEKE